MIKRSGGARPIVDVGEISFARPPSKNKKIKKNNKNKP